MKKLLAAFVAVSSLAGCATVPMAPAELHATVKKFNVPADKAGLYVYRDESFGGAVTEHVLLDNAAIGGTIGHT